MNKKFSIDTSVKAILITYAIVTFCIAFFRFDVTPDYLEYHLPTALRIFNLTTLELIYRKCTAEAPPQLPHLIQGFMVWITGRVSAANSINALAFIFFQCFAYRRLGIRDANTCIILTLTIPLVVTHLYTGYLDLWTGIFLSIAAYEATVGDLRSQTSQRMLIAMALVASLSRYQAWPFIVFFTIVATIRLRVINYPTKKLLILALCTLFGILVWLLRNYFIFVNPITPIRMPGFLDALFPIQSQCMNDTYCLAGIVWNQPEWLKVVPRMLKFLISFTEYSRALFPNDPFSWTYDMNQGDHYSAHFRLGGFFIVPLILMLIGIVNAWRYKAERPFYYIIFSSLIFLSLLPQSYDLRFWLFLPLWVSLLSHKILMYDWLKRFHEPFFLSLIVLCLYVHVKCLGEYIHFSFVPPEATIPASVSNALKTPTYGIREVCDTPYAIYYAGKDFNTEPVRYQCANRGNRCN